MHTDTMPSTCKNNIFPNSPLSVLRPSHPISFLHNCYKAVINLRLREGGGRSPRAEIKTGQTELQGISTQRSPFLQGSKGTGITWCLQCFQHCSGRQNKMTATKVCRRHKSWQSNSAGGSTELCRPPGMLGLCKSNTLTKANTQVRTKEQTN